MKASEFDSVPKQMLLVPPGAWRTMSHVQGCEVLSHAVVYIAIHAPLPFCDASGLSAASREAASGNRYLS